MSECQWTDGCLLSLHLRRSSCGLPKLVRIRRNNFPLCPSSRRGEPSKLEATLCPTTKRFWMSQNCFKTIHICYEIPKYSADNTDQHWGGEKVRKGCEIHPQPWVEMKIATVNSCKKRRISWHSRKQQNKTARKSETVSLIHLVLK